MAFIRVHKNQNYSVISNVGVRDDRLSWKARGILVYLLSLPEDWKIYESEVAEHAPDGRTSFRSGMKELQKYGYLTKERVNSAGGKFEYVHTIREEPCAGFPHTVNPSTDKPNAVQPNTDNETLLSTDELSTDELSTDRTKKENKGTTHQKPKKKVYMDFVKLTDEEYSKLIETYGQQATDKLLDNLNNYIGSKGDKYKSHYFTILNWAKRDGVRKGAVNAKSQKQDAKRYNLPF